MSGRGRGRGIPIAYPDGWACKPPPTGPFPTWSPIQPLRVRPIDREAVNLNARLLSAPTARAFRVAGGAHGHRLVRYSDRYFDAPIEPFSQVRAI
jgi:hypothetical protein